MDMRSGIVLFNSHYKNRYQATAVIGSVYCNNTSSTWENSCQSTYLYWIFNDQNLIFSFSLDGTVIINSLDLYQYFGYSGYSETVLYIKQCHNHNSLIVCMTAFRQWTK